MNTSRASTGWRSLTSPSDYAKVLVVTPTYEGKHYIFDKFYKRLRELTYPNYDFIIIDNSTGSNYVTKLRRMGVRNVHHCNRGRNSRDTLAISQNYAREYFLKGNYDYVFSLESDVIPPVDIIQRLMRHQKMLVGAVYLIGTGTTKLPCLFVTDKMESGENGTRLIGTKRLGGKLVSVKGEVEKYLNKGLLRFHGMGLGCTLIRRDLLSSFGFWTDERYDDKHSDVYFYLALHNKGYDVWADTDLMVDHWPSKWDEVSDR